MTLKQVFEKAPDETIDARLAACRACPSHGELPVVKTEVCKVCGCPLLNKTKFLKSTCPQGKW